MKRLAVMVSLVFVATVALAEKPKPVTIQESVALNVNLQGTPKVEIENTIPIPVALRMLPDTDVLMFSGWCIAPCYADWEEIGWENTTGYSASKSGLHSLGVALARELEPEGIVVNIVAPGTVDTPQQAVDAADANLSLEEYYAIRAQRIPARRIGRSEEIAATIAFLAGEGGPAFAGKILQPNGGEVRCSS